MEIGGFEITPAWIGSIVGALAGGTAITTITNYLLAKSKQPIDHYNALVERLETRINKLEADHEKCQNEHLKALQELAILNGRLVELRELTVRTLVQPPALLLPPDSPTRLPENHA